MRNPRDIHVEYAPGTEMTNRAVEPSGPQHNPCRECMCECAVVKHTPQHFRHVFSAAISVLLTSTPSRVSPPFSHCCCIAGRESVRQKSSERQGEQKREGGKGGSDEGEADETNEPWHH